MTNFRCKNQTNFSIYKSSVFSSLGTEVRDQRVAYHLVATVIVGLGTREDWIREWVSARGESSMHPALLNSSIEDLLRLFSLIQFPSF